MDDFAGWSIVIGIFVLPFLIEKISDLNIQLFVLDVIRPLEKELYSHLYRHELDFECDRYDYPNRLLDEHIRIFSHAHYEYIAALVHTIPIYLKDKGNMIWKKRKKQ